MTPEWLFESCGFRHYSCKFASQQTYGANPMDKSSFVQEFRATLDHWWCAIKESGRLHESLDIPTLRIGGSGSSRVAEIISKPVPELRVYPGFLIELLGELSENQSKLVDACMDGLEIDAYRQYAEEAVGAILRSNMVSLAFGIRATNLSRGFESVNRKLLGGAPVRIRSGPGSQLPACAQAPGPSFSVSTTSYPW